METMFLSLGGGGEGGGGRVLGSESDWEVERIFQI